MFQDIDGPEAKAVLLLGKVSQVKGLNTKLWKGTTYVITIQKFCSVFFFKKFEVGKVNIYNFKYKLVSHLL